LGMQDKSRLLIASIINNTYIIQQDY
jgi:hypothetical protein